MTVVRVLDAIRHRLRWLLRRSDMERDLEDELRAALAELTERHRARGASPEAARRAAAIELGGVDQIKEEVRAMQVGVVVEGIVRDARHAMRELLRAPAFTAAAIATLALGIGGSAAIFSVVDATLLQPLPYRDPDRLVFVWQDLADAGYPRAPLAGPELADLRERSTRFDGFGAIWANTATLSADNEPEQLRIGLVTPDFFDVLGAGAALGRTFDAADVGSSASPGVVLAWPLFQRRFSGDSAVVGRTIEVNGARSVVLGVMPEGFRLVLPPEANVPDDLQAWMLLDGDYDRGPRTQQYLRVVGRMARGVELASAQREVAAIGAAVGREFPEYGPSGATFYAVSLQDDSVRDVRPALLALSGGVGILLVIACVNVASLLVTRAAARRHETALRLALGAGRAAFLRACATEGLVLAALGGLAGLVVAAVALRVLLAFRPATLGRLGDVQLDLHVLAFIAAVVIGWGLLFSLAPFAEAFRQDPAAALAQRHARAGAAHVSYRTRSVLVVAQIGLSIVLLTGAALLVKGFAHLLRTDTGFDARHVLAFKLPYFSPLATTPEAATALSTDLRRRFEQLPGVRAVGATSHVPYDQVPNWGGPYLPDGVTDVTSARIADTRSIAPGWFETVGATLVDGRFFAETDTAGSRRVAIVDDRLAARTWPGRRAVGRRLRADPMTTGTPSEWVTVVGVVRHLRHRRATQEMNEQIYFPLAQSPRHPLAYMIRIDGDPVAAVAAVRDVVRRAAPSLPLFDVRPFDAYVRESRATQRFTMAIAIAFAIVALLLACVGVHGVVAYSVTLRRHEFGVRLALGARPRQVGSLVLADAGRLAGWGMVLGGVGAVLAARLLRHQLLGVSPYDAASHAAAAGILAACALAATVVPVRRACATDSTRALRSE